MGRLAVLLLILIAACAVFFGRLFNLQFASKDVYDTGFSSPNTSTVDIPTFRGEITDINGTVLASNKMTNNITLDKNRIPDGRENDSVLDLARFLSSNDIVYRDILPVTESTPHVLDADFFENSEKQKSVKSYSRYMGLEYEDVTESDTALYDTLIVRYGLYGEDADKKYSDSEKRIICGIRFTVDVNAYDSGTPCVIVENADAVTVGKISDSLHNFPGTQISATSKRYYNIDRLASHLLGRTGPIFAEDADYYREKGYSLNAVVGKDGAEYAFEEYLRGINGKKTVTLSEDGGTVLNEEVIVPAKPGYTVRLTIDAEMQAVAEKSLEKVITEQAARGKLSPRQYDGEDANAGTVVVMDPRNGAVRVLASYPTYNLNTYSDDISVLSKDEKNSPLLNRATGGIYEPGSTFKIATAAAALHYGVTDFEEIIRDEGEYDFHATYKPHCWIYDAQGKTHGNQNIVDAIMNSCNYFFFEMGKRLGIDNINKFASSLGLGVKTGIETGESVGILVSPQYMDANGLAWNPGYVLQAAIGQQHLFTPIQITSYISTFLNGGKRYRAHIFDSARDYATDELIESYEPAVLSETVIPETTVDNLKEAMRRVVDDGTASSTFVNYKYPVGGKTGTAQVSGGSDNVIFVGFAPYENPEIVVTVILEHGDLSRNAATVAKDIFDCYFAKLYPEDFAIVEITPDEGTSEENGETAENGEIPDESPAITNQNGESPVPGFVPDVDSENTGTATEGAETANAQSDAENVP